MNHNPESPSFARTQEWKAKAAQDVARVRAILPAGTSETARQKLIDATSKML